MFFNLNILNQISTYLNSDQIGKITNLNENINQHHIDKVKTSISIFSFRNSYIICETIEHGNNHCKEVSFYEDRVTIKSICNYLYNELDGNYKGWHNNGKLESESYYKEGKLHGKTKVWYDNGNMSLICNYENGKKNGLYTSFNLNGNIIYSVEYRDDILIKK